MKKIGILSGNFPYPNQRWLTQPTVGHRFSRRKKGFPGLLFAYEASKTLIGNAITWKYRKERSQSMKWIGLISLKCVKNFNWSNGHNRESVPCLDSSFNKLKTWKVQDKKSDDNVDTTHCQLPEPFIEVILMKKYSTITITFILIRLACYASLALTLEGGLKQSWMERTYFPPSFVKHFSTERKGL